MPHLLLFVGLINLFGSSLAVDVAFSTNATTTRVDEPILLTCQLNNFDPQEAWYNVNFQAAYKQIGNFWVESVTRNRTVTFNKIYSNDFELSGEAKNATTFEIKLTPKNEFVYGDSACQLEAPRIFADSNHIELSSANFDPLKSVE